MKISAVHMSIAIVVAAMLLAGCAPAATPAATPTVAPPASQPVATTAPAIAVTPAVIPTGWQVYTNPAGFAISYPAAWTVQAQPDSYEGNIHTDALKGPEGEVKLSWGMGFGGGCPPGYATVKIAQGYIQACYGKKADGTEIWSQMSQMLPNAGFSGEALTSNADRASHNLILQILSTLTFSQPPAMTSLEASYTDPFAYCAAVGTIDSPDARYTGPETPDSVLPIPAGAGTPPPFPEGSVYWRCMDGQVYTCVVGANIPCWDKADTSTTPTEGMQSFCKDQPDADLIPAYAAGNETIYAWSCKNGVPVMGEQIHQVDAQGYITDYWQQIPNPAASPAATPAGGTLHPPAAEVCNGMAQAMMQALNTEVTQSDEPVPMTDPVSGASGTACRATATGTGEQFTSPEAVIKSLSGVLTTGGWTEDPQLASGGPTGMGTGFRSGDLVCIASAIWHPDASANCPNDKPISECKVTPAQQLYTVTLDTAQAAP